RARRPPMAGLSTSRPVTRRRTLLPVGHQDPASARSPSPPTYHHGASYGESRPTRHRTRARLGGSRASAGAFAATIVVLAAADEKWRAGMRVLVCIAYYGHENERHVRELVAAYRAMDIEVDIVVVTEAEKTLEGVEQRVGL